MSGRIYLLSESSGLTPMSESPYGSEDLLQRLLSEHPDLLAGEQIDPDEPRRWQLVTREMGVPGEEDGSNRWSLDHLFLDQDGVPTLVEVKRSSDSRIRREVVGQMLDYAANAVAYWPVEEIRAKFEARCGDLGVDADDVIDEFAGSDHNASDFWLRVKTNLQAGRIRLVFVADAVPAELRRIVEFLNTQMDPAEVLAVEVRQFVGEGATAMVPRVFGQTEMARGKKGAARSATRPRISAEQFLKAVEACQSEWEQARIRRMLQWAQEEGLELNFRMNKIHPSFIPILHTSDRQLYPVSMWENGRLWIQMRQLKLYRPFDAPEMRDALHQRLKDVPGFTVTDAGMEGFPRFSIAHLRREEDLDRLLDALTWVVKSCRDADTAAVQPA